MDHVVLVVRDILEFINVWTLQSLLSYAMNKLSKIRPHDMGQEMEWQEVIQQPQGMVCDETVFMKCSSNDCSW